MGYLYPMMIRRKFLTSMVAIGIFGFARTAEAKGLSLNKISNYLNKMRTAVGSFTQVNPDGSISQGKFYLKKPGRIRFEYSRPKNALVLSNNANVAVFDTKSNKGPQIYPLKKTPLNLILRDKVNLRTSGMVRSVKTDGTKTFVKAIDPKHPKLGSITMVFTDNPVELRQWIIKDQSGKKTTVVLSKVKFGTSLSNGLFNINKEQDKRR